MTIELHAGEAAAAIVPARVLVVDDERSMRELLGIVLKRDGHRCAYCGARATTVDHILPASRGGDWSWMNAVAACEPCNFRKADRTPAEARMVLHVTPYVPTRAQLTAL